MNLTTTTRPNLLGILIAGMLAAGTVAGTSAWAATGHGHDHATGAHALTLNAGKKWTGDEPLRRSMTKIRDAVDAKLPAVHRGKLGTAQYDLLGSVIDTEIANIVQNCKLEPRADEVLHLILADMMAGNEILQGKDAGAARSAGVMKVVHSLEQYGKYFDHPGWKAPKLDH